MKPIIMNTISLPLKKQGKLFILKIPEHIIKLANLKLNDFVTCIIKNGNIIIKPVRKRYTLDELLEGTTEIEKELDWGEAIGEEEW